MSSVWLSYVMIVLVSIFLLLSVVYSFRYRRQQDLRQRGFYAARMNISMGLLLIFLALSQFVLFETNKVRFALGLVFLLLGLFNFFSGLRSQAFYRADRK